MEGIVPELNWSAKLRLRRQARECGDADLKTRYLIIVNLVDGLSATETAKCLAVHRSTVYRVAQRFRECGEAGLEILGKMGNLRNSVLIHVSFRVG
jgi:hypothetical protein